jgi:YD repeat-containing protein
MSLAKGGRAKSVGQGWWNVSVLFRGIGAVKWAGAIGGKQSLGAGNTFTYDNQGNVTTQVTPTGTYVYSYDQRNDLTSATFTPVGDHGGEYRGHVHL